MTLEARLAALVTRPAAHPLPFHGDAAVPLTWLATGAREQFDDFPELDDVAEELETWWLVAIAAPSEGEGLPVLVARAPPHQVAVFFEGFQSLAATLEAFERQLVSPGTATAIASLRALREELEPHFTSKDWSTVRARLSPALTSLDATTRQTHRDEVGSAWCDLGVACHALGDDAAAEEAYRQALAHGSDEAGTNLVQLAVAAKDWGRVRELTTELLRRWKPPEALTALRASLARALVELGDGVALEELAREHADWLSSRDEDRLRWLGALADALGQPAAGSPLGTLLETCAVPPARPGPEEVAALVEALREGKVLKARALLRCFPTLADHPEVEQARAALEGA